MLHLEEHLVDSRTSGAPRTQHVLARDARNRRRTRLAHDVGQFGIQDVDDRFDTGLTKCRETPRLWPADANGGSAKRQAP